MKHIIIVCAFLCSLIATAKDFSLIPYRSGSKWGYCDKQKKIIIKPKYDRTYWFADNGLARVLVNGKYGYIDKKGDFKIEAKFEKASDFSFSGALVELNSKKYCMDKSGALMETDSDNAFGCSGLSSAGGEGICSNCCEPFKSNNKWGIVCKEIKYINNTFETIAIDSIDAQYDTIYKTIGYSGEFMPLAVVKNGRCGIVSAKNKIVYDFEFDSTNIISYNLFVIKKNNVWTLRDTSQVLYSNFSHWDSYIFDSGYYFPIQVGNKWGVINSKGKEVIPIQFDEIKLPSDYIIPREFTVKTNGKWGFISDRGNISAIYDLLEPFSGEEYTLVIKNGKEGYIDRRGIEYFE